jgi:hypothetical protein
MDAGQGNMFELSVLQRFLSVINIQDEILGTIQMFVLDYTDSVHLSMPLNHAAPSSRKTHRHLHQAYAYPQQIPTFIRPNHATRPHSILDTPNQNTKIRLVIWIESNRLFRDHEKIHRIPLDTFIFLPQIEPNSGKPLQCYLEFLREV